jgi:MoaA/NifB/PqqE/SkfB family radical SAM enzyme
MEWETFETIVRKIREHVKGEKFSLSFSGMGEPMLNPSIYRFIKHVSEDAFTGFATNGAVLTEQNLQKLMDAGLDVVYVSFNGDEPGIYSKMMGGLSYDKVLGNLRNAVAVTKGSRLKINANVSVTKANRNRVSQIRTLLEGEGVHAITFSMCHSRGGNLNDTEVYDTPAQPEDDGRCDVLKNTLFVDWRGKVFICDHDIHGEYGYGDLVAEPLATILERRDKLLAEGLSFKICQECHDLLKVGFLPLESGAGGRLPDWIYELYREPGAGLSHGTTGFKWLYEIYKKEGRLDRLVNRLLEIEIELQVTIATEKLERRKVLIELEGRQRRIIELDLLIRSELEKKDQWIAELNRKIGGLETKLAGIKRTKTWRTRRAVLRVTEFFTRHLRL